MLLIWMRFLWNHLRSKSRMKEELGSRESRLRMEDGGWKSVFSVMCMYLISRVISVLSQD